MKNNGSLLPLISKVLIIVFLTASSIFSQTTYYISNSEGNDSNNGTSESSPWKSLNKLHSSWNQISPGDKILFKRGDEWSPSNISGRLGVIEIVNKNGTKSSPITINAYGSGNLPKITDLNKSSYGNTIRFKGSCSYIKISSLKIVGEILFNMDKNEFGATAGMHHISITDCEITDGRIGMDNYISTGPSVFSHVPNSNDPYTNPFYKIEIGGCTMTDQRATAGDDWINFIFGIRYIDENGNPTNYANRAKLDLTTGAMPDTNIWIHDNTIRNSYSENLDIPGGNLHLIERNHFYGSRLYGNVFKMHSEYSMISDCIIRDNVIAGSAYDSPTGSTAFGYALEGAQRCIIENNTMSARYPALFGDNENLGQDQLFGTFKYNIIRNNNFYGSVVIYGDANINSWGYTHDQEDSIAYINTFEGNNFWINPQWPEGRIIKAYNNNEKSIVPDGHSASGLKGNFTDIWVNTYPTNNEHHVNPQMTNPTWTSPDNPGTYTLSSGSPLIDAGSITGNDHIYDINLNQRTQATVDIGAYEWNGVDVTAPKVTGANLLDETTLLVSFSEPLNISTAQNTNNYTISNGVTVSNAAVSGYQVTLTTSAHSSGNFTVTVDNVQDLSGNTIGSNNTASYSYNSDNVAPELVSAQITNATHIELIFSEALNQTNAESANNYSINNGITVSAAILSNPSKVTLTTSEHSNGTYNIVVNNVTDIANNVIASNNTASYVYEFDSEQPEISSIEVLSPNSIKVVYSEKVQKLSSETKTNYSINNGISIINATLSSLENEVILSTSEHTGGSYTLTVNNILDLAGNMIQTNSTLQYNVEGDTAPPELSSITAIDRNTIEVFFSEPVNQIDAENIQNYSINNGINITSAVQTNSTKVTLATSTHEVGEYTLTVTNIHDISGNVIISNNSLSYSFAPQTSGPELLYAFAPQSNIVEVAFSKSVSQLTAENIQNYSISDDINVVNATLKSSGDAVSLEVSELIAEFHYTLTIVNIEDLEGNIINPDSNTTVFCYLNNPGPIALYDFTEGLNSNLIYDISCNGAPLHLTISDPTAITWLEGGGMSINSSVVISSDIASKLNNNCKQTNALTIEAWIKPANTTQNGPARIVSLSNDAFNRNFTLGQGEGTNNTYGYDVRLRTTATNNNGFPSVTASSPALTTNLTQVIYTRTSEGITKIYIDGVESFSTTLGGNLSNWDNSFKLILANEMTGDRPWLGEFYKVAIYDRALDSEEVSATFTEYNSTMLTNLRVFLEGPYSSINMSTDLLDKQIIPLDQPYSAEPWNYEGYERATEIPDDIVDWILLEVRTDDTTVVARRAAFLRKDGKVVDLNGISNVSFKSLGPDEYFISVIHRNHLSIISSEKVTLGKHSQLLDLTKPENVFGEGSTADLGNGVYGMYAGDTNCSSIITYSDALGIVQKNTKSGYNIADVNLSGIVTFADVTHVINNNTKSANFKVNK